MPGEGNPSRRSLGAAAAQDRLRSDLPPALLVAEGETFEVETGSILSRFDPETLAGFESLPGYSHLSIPVTGPIVLPDARPGDALQITIHEIRIADHGAMVTLPGRGALGTALKETGKLLPIVGDSVLFDDLALPVEPMIGKIGVGSPEAPHCSTVGPFGGNMDCRHVRAGATLLLPVFAAGAHLFVGDLHARQGDGEVSLTGVEVSGRVVLSCRLLRGLPLSNPLVFTPEATVAIADGGDLDEAVRRALDDMAALVMRERGWSLEKAAMFLSIAADVGVCQIVNPRPSAMVALPTRLCPLGMPVPGGARA